MRNGRKPLRNRDRAFEVTSSVGRLENDQTDPTIPTTPVADDLPGMQLALDSLDPLDEPAEVLIRVSSEALESNSDLVDDGGNGGEDDDEIENLTGHERFEEAAEVDEAVDEALGETIEPDENGQADPSVVVDPTVAEVAADGEVAPESAVDATEEIAAGSAGVEAEAAEPASDSTSDSTVSPVEAAAAEPASEDFVVGPVVDSAEPVVDEVFTEAHGTDAEVAVRTAELSADPVPYEPAEALLADDPALQIRLARVHLKTGSLTIARAELEALAARNQLDVPAHLDLAEVRWRTGDLDGAGEAAGAYMDGGGDEALGFVIAAEASAMANRLDEARRHTEQALERHMSELDPVFAGIRPKAVWDLPDWGDAAPEAVSVPMEVPAAVSVPATVEPPAPVEPEAAEPPAVELPEPEAAPVEPEAAELPEEVEVEAAAPPEVKALAGEQAPNDVQANAEVAFGGLYLDADDPMMAALHFGVAIRLAPTSAKAVLDAIGDREDLALQLVRGDALRLLGMEGDAGKAYQSVASALAAPKPAQPEPPTTEPEPPAAPVEPEPEPEPRAESLVDEPPAMHWDD
jgi:tetratricopeptide (TPR) repeat protein